jgi:hypothetical protein
MPTVTRTTNVAVHTISFRGLAGAIFVCLALASILYVIGFATTEWSVDQNRHDGLWASCTCGQQLRDGDEDWFKATQAMVTIGLIGLLLAMILACIYLCIHSVSKNCTILTLVIVCFLSCIFMIIGFIIYGVKRPGLSWSYVCAVISSILTFVAGVLAVFQIRDAGVRL